MIPADVIADYDYHVVELTTLIPDEVYNWCYEKFGAPGRRWFSSSFNVYFYNKTDHIMFVLRWA